MLIETKGITELGLTFGNTRQVIGVVICSILVMAFFANFVVQRFRVRRLLIPFLFLFSSLALGWVIAKSGGALHHLRKVGNRHRSHMSEIFPWNRVFRFAFFKKRNLSSYGRQSPRSDVRGLLEYNSMYFGFRFLYLLAMSFYVLSLIVSTVRHSATID